jgi:septin family protein
MFIRKKSKKGLATSLILRNALGKSTIMNRLISKDLDEIKERKKFDFIRGILENSIKIIDHVTNQMEF